MEALSAQIILSVPWWKLWKIHVFGKPKASFSLVPAKMMQNIHEKNKKRSWNKGLLKTAKRTLSGNGICKLSEGVIPRNVFFVTCAPRVALSFEGVTVHTTIRGKRSSIATKRVCTEKVFESSQTAIRTVLSLLVKLSAGLQEAMGVDIPGQVALKTWEHHGLNDPGLSPDIERSSDPPVMEP